MCCSRIAYTRMSVYGKTDISGFCVGETVGLGGAYRWMLIFPIQESMSENPTEHWVWAIN